MEEITENILLDNGFRDDNHDGFSYTGKGYAIDILYSNIPIKGRPWLCVVYSNNMRHILATMLIQTIEQFNDLMDETEIDFRLKTLVAITLHTLRKGAHLVITILCVLTT